MPSIAPVFSFKTIRHWDGSQHRAFDAAAVVLPELHGIELPDLLATEVKTSASANDRFGAKYGRQHLVRLFLGGLPHRSRESITERTIGPLNDAIRTGAVDPSDGSVHGMNHHLSARTPE